MIKVKNMDIEEAVKLYDELQARQDVVRLHFSRKLAEMDEKNRIEEAEEKAKKRADKRIKAAVEDANKKIQDAVEEANRKNMEMIKNLITQNVDSKIIMKVAGITKDKLNEIRACC